jgi:hypothetical protein
MKSVGRTIIAVLAGAAIWAILWVGGTQAAAAAFPNLLAPGQPVTHGGALVGLIMYSVLLSVLAGYGTAAVATGERMRAVWVLAILQLAIGVMVEASAWNLTPVWYHLVFLALLIPATVYGGALRVRRGETRAAYMT